MKRTKGQGDVQAEEAGAGRAIYWVGWFVSFYELSLDEKDKRTRRRPTDLFWYLTDRRAQRKNAEFAAFSTSIFRSSAVFFIRGFGG